MAKNNKVVKYKVININVDKKFIGKDLDLQKVKSKSRPTTKTRLKAPAWFIEFRDEQREFNTRIEKDIANLKSDFSILKNDVSSLKKTQDQQNKHLQRIDSRLDRLENRIDNLVVENNLKE